MVGNPINVVAENFIVWCRNQIFQRASVLQACVEVPDLWIGDCTSGPYYKDFDTIIDCTEGLNLVRDRAPDYRLGLHDIHNPDPTEYWRKQRQMLRVIGGITPIIADRLRKGQRVLVHCRAGKQRSASIIAAYLILYKGWTPSKAIAHMQLIPGTFYPRCNFHWALNRLISSPSHTASFAEIDPEIS